ncbi:MAG: hypothetical protein ACI9R3_001113 [Verrucomicrobiales bacterium]|jgi:hypothetical protein
MFLKHDEMPRFPFSLFHSERKMAEFFAFPAPRLRDITSILAHCAIVHLSLKLHPPMNPPLEIKVPTNNFSCEDCAVEEARVAPAGGNVCKPKFAIGEFGFISLVSDTEGNMIGLHSLK